MNSDMNKDDFMEEIIPWGTPDEEPSELTAMQRAEREQQDRERAKRSVIRDIAGDDQALDWLMELSLGGGCGGYLHDTWSNSLAGELVGNGWCVVDPDDEVLTITAAGFRRVIDAYQRASEDGHDVSEQLAEAVASLDERIADDRDVGPNHSTSIVLASARYYHLMSHDLRSAFWDRVFSCAADYALPEHDKRLLVVGFLTCATLSVGDEAAAAILGDAAARLGFAFDIGSSTKAPQ